MDKLKICLAGASGTGKTTIGNYIAEICDIPFLRGSSGLLLNSQDKVFLQEISNGEWHNHREVIQFSSNPIFSYNYQALTLKRRTELILTNDRFITDRSPIDNLVYFLSQASFGLSEEECTKIIDLCLESYIECTHIIFIPVLNPTVEDNKSRIANLYYQKMIGGLFKYAIKEYFYNLNAFVKVLEINTWDYEDRKKQVSHFLAKHIKK